jgi:hypothetical protein
MSLVTSASSWTNDEFPKKRIPSMRKTVKKTPVPLQNVSQSSPDEYNPAENEYQPTQEESLLQVQVEQEERNHRVAQLLGNMERVNYENDGNKLANFHPLSHPAIQKKADYDATELQPAGSGANPLQIPPPQLRRNTDGEYAPNAQGLGISQNPYSNYRKIYEPPKIVPPANYYSKMGLGTQPTLDTKLMEKINYMIHMLEQQQNEKTSNLTEEFILYSLLGVFIIFIVDSFARAGKYVR